MSLVFQLLGCFFSSQVSRVVSRDNCTKHFMNEDEHEEILRLEDSFESAFMSSEMEKKWRKLPRNLSLIYLGESHSFYILIVNDSVKESVKNVSVKVDLQFANERVINIGVIKCDLLDAKQTLEEVMKHDIKDLGAHV